MAAPDSAWITLGTIGAPYGVKGWVKVNSYAEPLDNIFNYDPWYLRREDDQTGQYREVHLENAREHGKGLVAKLPGCDDRDAAVLLRGLEIVVRRDQLPPAEEGEYYWIDLIGLRVETLDGTDLGVVDHLLATGANDVLVVKGERERLIPYVLEHIVQEVDLDKGLIRVDWDADF